MRYWIFLLVPLVLILLIFGYMGFINSLANSSTSVTSSSTGEKTAGAEVIGVSQVVSVQIIRAKTPYLFGLVQLPTYVDGIGSISLMNAVFFWLLVPIAVLLTYGLVIIERGDGIMAAGWKSQKSFDRSNVWVKLGKSLGVGALFALVTYLIFAPPDGSPSLSLSLGLLVAYMEFRMMQE